LTEFFNEHKIYDYSTKRVVLEKVVKKHVWDKLNKDPIFIPNIIERANEYNEETQGCITTIPWWNPFITRTIKLTTTDLNTLAPTLRRSWNNPWILRAVGLASVGAFIIGKHSFQKLILL